MAEEIYTLLNSSINRNELDETKVLLSKLPLEEMTQESTDSLLQSLLIIAHRANSLDVATLLLDEFDKLTPNDERNLTSFTKLFGFLTFPDNALKWLINTLDNESYIFVIEELLRYDANEELLPSFVRATELFNIVDPTIFETCLESAKNEDNANGVWFFSDQLKNISDFVDDAPYVANYLDVIPIYKELKVTEMKFQDFVLPPIEEIINLLTAGFESFPEIQIDEAREALRKELSTKTDAEIFDMVRPILLNLKYFELNENLELFRIMGPVNPSFNSDFTIQHLCYSVGGGHRMFYCTCYEIDVEDEPRDEWFTGSCQVCLKRIKNRANAMRLPLATGGFRGCYCSVQCVKNSLIQVDILTNLMLDEMLKVLRKFGVQDRREDPDDVLPEPNAEVRISSYSEDY